MKNKKKIISVIMIILSFFLLYFYYTRAVNPIIREYTKAKVNALTEQVLNSAVSNVINASLNYDSIMNISYTNTGEIAYLQANQYVVNTITREVIKYAQEMIIDLGEDGVKIPIGTFSGMSILNGRGPNVKLEMVPVGIIASNFKSEFINVGINNTLHQLFLNVTANVELIMPLKNCKISVEQSVLLCEGIIVGKVPEMYFNNDKLYKTFDLLP